MEKTMQNKLTKLFKQLYDKGVCSDILERAGCVKTIKWVENCYHAPSWIEVSMAAADELMEGYGVEAIRENDIENCTVGTIIDGGIRCMDIVATYVNMGDSYAPTLIRDHVGQRFLWGRCVGDLIEKPPAAWLGK